MLTLGKSSEDSNKEHVFDDCHYSLWRTGTMFLLTNHDPVEAVTKKQDHSTEEEVLINRRQRETIRRLWQLISSDVLTDFADSYSARSLWPALADGYAPDSVT